MDLDFYRDYCLKKPGVTEGMPFGEDVLVFKVMGKMFALASIVEFRFINLKCDPERAIELRANHLEITPGYHMSKKHWNSVSVLGDLNNELILELIDHSYNLVVASLTKKLKNELRAEKGE